MICYYKEILDSKKVYLSESQLRMLTEGAETRHMKLAKHFIYDRLGKDESRAMKIIGSIKTDIPNVRLGKCKFILGITRMFLDNQLTNGEEIMGINKALKYIASDAHINEYDSNLNNLSANDIIQRFSGIAKQDMENEKEMLSQQSYVKSDYNIVKIPDFETASQYGEYTDWCVTQYNDMYQNYTHGGLGVFYFCLKNGFENVEAEEGENCPLDEYGLSMIAVSVNADGSPNTITCRWNHAHGGNDNIMTPQELSNIIGYNFYDVFKPYSEEELEKKKIRIIDEFAEYTLYDLNEGIYDNCEFICKDDNSIAYEDDDDEYYDQMDYADFIIMSPNNEIADTFGIDDKQVIYDNQMDSILVYKLFDDVKYDNGIFFVRENGKEYMMNTQGEYLLDGTSFSWIEGISTYGYAKTKPYYMVCSNGFFDVINVDNGERLFNGIYNGERIWNIRKWNANGDIQLLVDGSWIMVNIFTKQMVIPQTFENIKNYNSLAMCYDKNNIITIYGMLLIPQYGLIKYRKVMDGVVELLGTYNGKYYKVRKNDGNCYYIETMGKNVYSEDEYRNLKSTANKWNNH